MKRLFTLIISIAASTLGFSQYFYIPNIDAGMNPAGLNTDEDQTAAYMLSNFTGYTQIINPGASTWSSVQSIPFSFDFNGSAVSNFYVSSNGVLTFSSTPGSVPSDVNAAIPSASIPDNSVLVWGLNCVGSNDGVIRKVFGTSPNRQLWITWASASWNGMSSGGSTWAYWSIVLQESTNSIFIVDARNYASIGTGPALTAGIQVDGTTAYSIAGSPALTSQNITTGGNDLGPDDNTFYEFRYGVQPGEDIRLNNVNTPDVHEVSTPLTIEGSLSNLGANTLNSFNITYSVDGGAPVSSTVTGINVASAGSYNYTHSVDWTPTMSGSYDLKVWTSVPNGNADANPIDDTVEVTVSVVDTVIQRVPLYEVYTSSTCGPCYGGNLNFHNVVAAFPDEYVSIKYQQDFPGAGDPYFTTESGSRRAYYGINSIPRMEIDGGWDGNAQSFTAALHQQQRAIPSFFAMELEYEIDADSQMIEWCLDIDPYMSANNVTLQVAILETVTYQNVKTNGETEFHEVMKKMYPNQNGSSISLTAGTAYNACDSYVFNGSYSLPPDAGSPINHNTENSVENFDNLYVIAWLQNDNTMEVYQSVKGEYRDTTVSVNDINLDQASISVYPNPANNAAKVKLNVNNDMNVEVLVYDMLGKLVDQVASTQINSGLNEINLNTSKYTNGVYNVVVKSEGEQTTKRLVIQK